jgi:hypothetical protein
MVVGLIVLTEILLFPLPHLGYFLLVHLLLPHQLLILVFYLNSVVLILSIDSFFKVLLVFMLVLVSLVNILLPTHNVIDLLIVIVCLLLVLSSLDHHGSLIRIHFWVIQLLTLFLVFFPLFSETLIQQVLVVCEELLDGFLGHGEGVWVLIVLFLQVLHEDGFLHVVEFVDVDQLVVPIFFPILLLLFLLLPILVQLFQLRRHFFIELLSLMDLLIGILKRCLLFFFRLDAMGCLVFIQIIFVLLLHLVQHLGELLGLRVLFFTVILYLFPIIFGSLHSLLV